LSQGEYVVPADVVSHLGNGSTDAGAQHLDNMTAHVRQQRTGNPQQPPRMNAGGLVNGYAEGGKVMADNSYMNGGIVALAKGGKVVIPVPVARPVNAMDYPVGPTATQPFYGMMAPPTQPFYGSAPPMAYGATPMLHPGQDKYTVPFMDEEGGIAGLTRYIPSISSAALTGNPWASTRQQAEQLRIHGMSPPLNSDWLMP